MAGAPKSQTNIFSTLTYSGILGIIYLTVDSLPLNSYYNRTKSLLKPSPGDYERLYKTECQSIHQC